MNDEEFGSFKLPKLKYRRADQKFSTSAELVLPSKKLGPPSLIWRKIQKPEKSTAASCRTHWNLMNDEEFGSFKLLKLKYRREDEIIQLFCRIGSTQEIRSPLFNLRKFQKPEKSTAESCRRHGNLMNDEKFGSFKFLKLKYRRGDQIIQPICRIGSPQEIRSPVINLMNFQKA